MKIRNSKQVFELTTTQIDVEYKGKNYRFRINKSNDPKLNVFYVYDLASDTWIENGYTKVHTEIYNIYCSKTTTKTIVGGGDEYELVEQ